MNNPSRFQQRYEKGEIPWDVGVPDDNLIRIVKQYPIPPGRALDVGCGTGDCALWLASEGFETTGVDIVELAVAKAKQKSAAQKIACAFSTLDYLAWGGPGEPFDLVFDRGCFHSMDSQESRTLFAEKTASLLKEKGLWLSLIGNADAPPRDHGPPMLTALEVVSIVEPMFEVKLLEAGTFHTTHQTPPPIWICMLQKRSR